MVEPRLWAEAVASVDGRLMPIQDHDPLVQAYRGFTPSGIFFTQPSYLISYNGIDYYANNAYQTVYGGSLDVGGADGAKLSDVLQHCLNAGGLTYLRNSCTTLDAAIDLKNNSGIDAEVGTTLTYTGAATTKVFSNVTPKLRNFHMNGLTLDINNVANVYPFFLDSAQRCSFRNLRVLNSHDKPVFTIHASETPNPPETNTAFLLFDHIFLDNVYGAFEWQGSASGSEITLCKMQNIWADNVHVKGIAFKGYASGIHGDTIWIDLDTAGATGVAWNDTATPTVYAADYDNSFVNLKIDALAGTSNHATTTFLKFNATKANVVRVFFHSPVANDFLGITVGTISETISYLVEDTEGGPDNWAAMSDLYPRIYQKGYAYGSPIFDNIALYGAKGGSQAYVSLNDLYSSGISPQILMRTNSGAGNKESIISANSGDDVFRINPATDAIIKLSDNAGVRRFYFHDSDNSIIMYIDSNGEVCIYNSAAGVILKDRNTGAYYRLKVSGGGTLGTEAV